MEPHTGYSRARIFRGRVSLFHQNSRPVESAMRKVSLPSLLAVVLVCSAICFGQTGIGEVTGTVRDASGAVVSGAKVTVQSVNTGLMRDTTTNSSGIYTVPSL